MSSMMLENYKLLLILENTIDFINMIKKDW